MQALNKQQLIKLWYNKNGTGTHSFHDHTILTSLAEVLHKKKDNNKICYELKGFKSIKLLILLPNIYLYVQNGHEIPSL